MKILKETYKTEELREDGIFYIKEVERDLYTWTLGERTEQEQEYIEKHINKALQVLKSIAYPHQHRKFLERELIGSISIEDSRTTSAYFRRPYNKEDNYKFTLGINKKYLKNMYKRKYNKELIESLMHEFIHAYCYYHTRIGESNIVGELDWHGDVSPIFISVITWINQQFNNKGINYHIELNGCLERDFVVDKEKKWTGCYQKELYKKISSCKNFHELTVTLFDYQIKFRDKLEKYIINFYKKHSKEKYKGIKMFRLLNFRFDKENNSISSNEIDYKKMKIRKNGEEIEAIHETNCINIGLDLDIFEDSKYWNFDYVIGYLLKENYVEDIEEADDYELNRYLKNDLDEEVEREILDVEIIDLDKKTA